MCFCENTGNSGKSKKRGDVCGRSGRISPQEPFEEMGYAKLDMHRKVRSGFAEVIYCAGKADEHLLHIFERLYKADGQFSERGQHSISTKYCVKNIRR